jgi:hypothetical protein
MRWPPEALLLALLALPAGCGKDADTAAPSVDTSVPEEEGSPFADVQAAVNPAAPCVLEASWTQQLDSEAVWVEFEWAGGGPLTSPRREGVTGEHREALLGAPCGEAVTWRLWSEQGGALTPSEDRTLSTAPPPGALPLPDLLAWDPLLAGPEPWVMFSVDEDDDAWYGGPFWIVITDREGRPVWYYEVPDSRGALYVHPSRDGTHVISDATALYVFDPDVEPYIHRFTLDFAYDERLVVPDLGFTYGEAEGGAVLVEASSGDQVSLVQIARDGSRETIWDCSAWMVGLGQPAHGCFPNFIRWVPETDAVIWSMYQVDTAVEVDRATGEVVSQWGQLQGGWLFVPRTSMFSFQHYPHYTSEGTLLVSTHTIAGEIEQRAREFTVDRPRRTLTEIWSYGEGVDRYAKYSGEATRTGQGNTLIGYGTGGALREVTPAGELAWELEWLSPGHSHLIGHATLLEDLYALNQGPDDQGSSARR